LTIKKRRARPINIKVVEPAGPDTPIHAEANQTEKIVCRVSPTSMPGPGKNSAGTCLTENRPHLIVREVIPTII
jgi:hypothetical protein